MYDFDSYYLIFMLAKLVKHDFGINTTFLTLTCFFLLLKKISQEHFYVSFAMVQAIKLVNFSSFVKVFQASETDTLLDYAARKICKWADNKNYQCENDPCVSLNSTILFTA